MEPYHSNAGAKSLIVGAKRSIREAPNSIRGAKSPIVGVGELQRRSKKPQRRGSKRQPRGQKLRRVSPAHPRLTSRRAGSKNGRVETSREHFYAAWRECRRNVTALREENGFPTERLLQAIWQHQRLRRDQLQTTDGRPVRVFHPGFVSVEGGPDFRGAVLQLGDAPSFVGDVEVDLRSSGWHAHGHDRNPNFKNVRLQVVWEEVGPANPGAARPVPPATVSLKAVLEAPLAELVLSLENEPVRSLPENLRGQCAAPLRELNERRLEELLHAAARVRLENKAAQFHARARHVGWEQTLWESLFRGLGYKHNNVI